MKTEELITERLVLRQFKEADYDDLYEFLSQLKDDEFEGYPGITYENGREHLKYRVGSEEFYAIELKESGKVIGNCKQRLPEKGVWQRSSQCGNRECFCGRGSQNICGV